MKSIPFMGTMHTTLPQTVQKISDRAQGYFVLGENVVS